MMPGKRKKWKRLIKLIKQWKINWLLSYSPDRQARNMVEWWEIIDCVDQWFIDLKYTNFHFESTASWKMMLGIWFVFSKQYSDKLSEDISRWYKTKKINEKVRLWEKWNMDIK
jgi:DNA invertase Pin-like site-specific DNA recombinase